MSCLSRGAMLFALLAALSFSEAVFAAPQSFSMQWLPNIPSGSDPEDPPVTYLSSDLDAVPAVSANTALICAGGSVQLTFSSTANWNTVTALDGATTHSATSRDELYAASSSPRPYSVQWLSQTQSNSLYNYNSFGVSRFFQRIPAPNEWTTFLSSNGIPTSYPQYNAGLYYKCPNLINGYFSSNGGADCNPIGSPSTRYLAHVALFCNAKANMAVSGGPSYSDDFMGSNIVKTVSGLSTGSHTVSANLAVQRCMAPILDDGTFPFKSTLVTISNTFTPSYAPTTTPTITVENPFTCSISSPSGSVSNPAPNPSATISFSVNIANGGNKDISVTAITLSQPTQFSNLAGISPALPFTINAGGSRAVSGTVQVPAVAGTYSLRLNVTSQTTSADCTGAVKSCNAASLYVADITVTPAVFPDYVVSIAAPATATVGVPFTVQANTTNAGTGAASSPSTTQVNFSGVSRNLRIAPLAAGITSQNSTTFTCTSAGSFTITAAADAIQNNVSESNEANNGASRAITCVQPDYVPVVAAPLSVTVGVPFTIWANTSNTGTGAGGAASNTQINLTGFAPANHPVASLNPGQTDPFSQSYTCASAGTLSLRILVDSGAAISETNELNNLYTASISCTIAPQPDYTELIGYAPPTANVGVPFSVVVNTTNIGAGTLVSSVTQVNFTGVPSQNVPIPGLAAGASNISVVQFTCATPGSRTITAQADSGNAITESGEGNNLAVPRAVSCRAPDYAPIVSAPSSVLVGVPFTVQVNTTNIGPEPAIANSNTQINLTGFLPDNRPVGLLNAGQADSYTKTYTCASPGTLTLNISVDSTGAIVESDESNNFFTVSISCGVATRPDYVPQVAAPPVATVNASFLVIFTTRNNGTGAAANSSVTRVTFPLNPTTNWGIVALPPNGASTFSTTLTCPSTPGIYTLNITVDANNNVSNELNETNNRFLLAVNCTPLLLPNYVPRVSAPANAVVGTPFSLSVNTSNMGSAAASNVSITQVNFTGGTPASQNISVAALASGSTQPNSTSLTCASPGVKSISVVVDARGNVAELSDADNSITLTINCSLPAVRCLLSFVNHSALFLPNDRSSLNALCFDTIGAATGCPQLSWSQNAINASISPASTLPGASPQSNLTVGSAAPVQNNVAVTATSTTFSCAAPFNITSGTLSVSCNLSFVNHSGLILQGESVQARAACYNLTGGQANCTSLGWSENTIGASVSPASTLPSPSPQVLLSAGWIGPLPENGILLATGSSYNCSLPFTIGTGIGSLSITCGMRAHSQTFFPGDFGTVEANCSLGAARMPCPLLNWSVSLTGANMSPQQTPSGTLSPASLLSVSGSAPSPQSGRVNVACASAAECSANCSVNVSTAIVPNRMSCTLVNHSTGSLFTPNDWSYAQASCYKETTIIIDDPVPIDIGTSGLDAHWRFSKKAAMPMSRIKFDSPGGSTTTRTPTACPDLNWFTNISGGNLTPSFTLAQQNPLTNFSTTNAPTPQNGIIDATSASLTVPGLRCAAALSAIISPIGPDYAITGVRPERLRNSLGQTFTIEVKVKNIGNQNVTSAVTTTRLSGNCTLVDRQVPSLRINQEFTDTFSCACGLLPSMNTFTVEADIFNGIAETNEGNNRAIGVFWCGSSFIYNCSDYV